MAASLNISNAVFQISKSGYKHYTSNKFLKVLLKIHPVVWAGSCVMYIVGVVLSSDCYGSSCTYRYLIQKATPGDGYRTRHQCVSLHQALQKLAGTIQKNK